MSNTYYVVQTIDNVVYDLIFTEYPDNFIDDRFANISDYYLVDTDDVDKEQSYEAMVGYLNEKNLIGDSWEVENKKLHEIVNVGGVYYIQPVDAEFSSWTKDSDGLWTTPDGKRPNDTLVEEDGVITITQYSWDEDSDTWVTKVTTE